MHMLCHRNGKKNKGTLRDTKPLGQGTRCQRSLPCKSTCVGVTVPLTFARPVSFRSGLSSWHRRSCDLKQRSPSSGCSRSRGLHLRPARGTLGQWMHGRSGSRGLLRTTATGNGKAYRVFGVVCPGLHSREITGHCVLLKLGQEVGQKRDHAH